MLFLSTWIYVYGLFFNREEDVVEEEVGWVTVTETPAGTEVVVVVIVVGTVGAAAAAAVVTAAVEDTVGCE